jgi:glycosyltransferase involved in cell wall biosynthesis
MPRIGVFMPAWNTAEYIGLAIKSILAQDFGDWALAVLDDGSNDGTLEAAVAAADSRCVVARNETRSGLIGKMKNQAISMLPETEFICHVGSDDLITPDCFSSYVEFMDRRKDLAAACGKFQCFDKDKAWMFRHVEACREFDNGVLLRYMNFFPHRFYRREAVAAVGGYSNELSSAVDYDLALRLDEKFKLGMLDRPTYLYRQHPTQVSASGRRQQDLNAKKALQAALDRRGFDLDVLNDAPPFQTRMRGGHFIWGGR